MLCRPDVAAHECACEHNKQESTSMTTKQNSEREFPRQYVALDADFGKWETAEPYFKELAGREIGSIADFENWLFDYSELVACLSEEGTQREIDRTCQTDDPERMQRYLDFIENVVPYHNIGPLPGTEEARRAFQQLEERRRQLAGEAGSDC